jgi:Uma2 family endonuclease
LKGIEKRNRALAIQKKTYSAAQFSDIAAEADNADRILELIEGEIVEKVASFTPSRIASRLNFFLMQHVMERESGYVTGEAGGYVISKDNVFNPDVAYISKARLPQAPLREAPVPPDLAIEIKSPTDRKRAMRTKAEKYLAAGTRLVWLVFPDEKLVEVYAPDEDVQTIGIDGTLDGGDVLPDFKLAVSKIFAE